MGVFEDVFSKAKNAADYAGKKTGELVGISKLRLSAANVQDKINKSFQELGYAVYQAGKDGGDPSAAVKEKSAAIDSLYSRLSELNRKIDELRKVKKCPACGHLNQENANYCEKCGTKL